MLSSSTYIEQQLSVCLYTTWFFLSDPNTSQAFEKKQTKINKTVITSLEQNKLFLHNVKILQMGGLCFCCDIFTFLLIDFYN